MVRRAIAVGAGVLVVIVLFLGIKGCLGAQKDDDFKKYSSDANSWVSQSNDNVSNFFKALTGTKDSLGVQNDVNSAKVNAQDLVNQAKGNDHPDELNTANNWIVQTLEFRAEAMDKIAGFLPDALGSNKGKSQEAVKQIAAEMQGFVASDVIYQARARPAFQSAFDARNISRKLIGSQTPPSRNPEWMTPQYVADALSGNAPSSDKAATPGLHGTALGAVSIGGTELTQDADNSVPAAGAAVDVQVENQGESEETDIPVTVTIKGAGSPIEKNGTVPSVAAGETATVTIPLGSGLPTDGSSELSVSVAPVPGEETTDNNKGSYQVTFTK